jgi:hypothetical protein
LPESAENSKGMDASIMGEKRCPVKFLIYMVLAASSCSHGGIHGPKPASLTMPWGVDLAEVPEARALQRWSDPGFENANKIDLNLLGRIELPASCIDKHLYPTHPHQLTKIYHVYRVGDFNQSEVPANSQICKISSRPTEASAKKFCLRADSYHHAVISDTFADACGNFYRGIWRVGFLKSDETMGTLFSKGRTLYQNPKSEFENDLVVGPTYALERKDFLFLTPLFDGDLLRIKKIREDSLRYHVLNPQTHLFTPINR